MDKLKKYIFYNQLTWLDKISSSYVGLKATGKKTFFFLSFLWPFFIFKSSEWHWKAAGNSFRKRRNSGFVWFLVSLSIIIQTLASSTRSSLVISHSSTVLSLCWLTSVFAWALVHPTCQGCWLVCLKIQPFDGVDSILRPVESVSRRAFLVNQHLTAAIYHSMGGLCCKSITVEITTPTVVATPLGSLFS